MIHSTSPISSQDKIRAAWIPATVIYPAIPLRSLHEYLPSKAFAVPCPSVDKCCPVADTCQQSGCCRDGTVECSDNTCYDPETEVCCKDGKSCPIGQDCVPGGCCPTGQQPCGSSHCYDPETDQCCKDERGCDKGLTCCGQECCSKYATCNDGDCEGITCTITSTYSTTSFATQVNTVTKVREPEGEEDAPEFTCVPMTATDAVGDTLELGDDCGLTFQPADASPTDSSPSTTTTPTPKMKPRAPQADDTCLYTSTSVVTYTKNTITTTTTTVTGEEPSQSFSCPPMSVTNRVGDELSLDEECKLALSPGSSSTAVTTTRGGQPPGSTSTAVTTRSGGQPAGPTGEGMRLRGASGCATILAVLVQTLSVIFT